MIRFIIATTVVTALVALLVGMFVGLTMFNAALIVITAAFWGYTFSKTTALVLGAFAAIGYLTAAGVRR